MPKFNKAKILLENVCITCETENQSIALLKWAHSAGYRWSDGASFIEETKWNKHVTCMTYYIRNGTYGTNGYTAPGYTNLSYDEILEK